MAAFMLQQPNRTVAKETIWAHKLKIFTIWSFYRKKASQQPELSKSKEIKMCRDHKHTDGALRPPLESSNGTEFMASVADSHSHTNLILPSPP